MAHANAWRNTTRTLGWAAVAALLLGLAGPAQAKEPATAGVAVNGPTAEVVQLVNEQIAEAWKANSLTPSAEADDYTFIRRVSLDLIGRIATPKEIDDFRKQPAASRRTWLIEQLLKSEEYNRHWANLWSNWLLTRSGVFGRNGYYDQGNKYIDSYKDRLQVWLEDQFAQNKPHDELVKALIAAAGKSDEAPAVNFILAHVGEAVPRAKRGSEEGMFDMVPVTSRITRLFLGIRTQCTQCHDHPFDNRLKQEHFWGVNVFLRQVQQIPEQRPLEANNRGMQTFPTLELKDDSDFNSEAALFFEKRNGVFRQTKAVFLDGTKLAASPGRGRREELADLIVNHEMFPKAFVNRLWAHFFGRGFVNPIDDFNDQNEPSHPDLLAELGKKIKHYKYNQKDLIRWVCNSKPYNLSCQATASNAKPDAEPFFSRMLLKVMSPEQLFESLTVAVQIDQNTDAKKKARTVWLSGLIANFGDDEGNEVSFNGTVVQALMMMNGKDINEAIAQSGMLAKALGKRGGGNARNVVNDLYLATLNRAPTATELGRISQGFQLRSPQAVRQDLANPAAKYQDLLWALVNSNEFMLNH